MNSPTSSHPGPGLVQRAFGNAYLLLPFAMLCWGANATVGKLAAPEMTPITLTFLRWVGAVSVMLVVAWPFLRKDWPMLRREWKTVLALGASGFALFNMTFYWALHHTSAINVAIEQAAMPALIIVGNFLLFRQTVRGIQVLGISITFVGVAVTVFRGDLQALLAAELNRGDAIMVLALILYSAYAVGLRFKPNMHWLSLLAGMSVGSLLTMLPFIAWEAAANGIVLPGINGWLMVAFIVLFPSLIAQLFFMRGVELIGANRAGVFINLVPIFGAVLAVAILGEPLELYHFVGLALVMGGIAIAEKFAPR